VALALRGARDSGPLRKVGYCRFSVGGGICGEVIRRTPKGEGPGTPYAQARWRILAKEKLIR